MIHKKQVARWQLVLQKIADISITKVVSKVGKWNQAQKRNKSKGRKEEKRMRKLKMKR